MEEQSLYPPKPKLEIRNEPTNWGKTVFSVLLFFLVFYLFFGMEIATVAVLVGVVLVHELGHFLSMRAFGYKNVKMMFVPFMGAYTSGQKEDVPYRHELVTLLAGPVPGIVAGMILLPFTNQEEADLITTGTYMLLGLNLFNMLPIMPLDGGRIFDKLFIRSRFWLRLVFLGLGMLGIIAYQLIKMEVDIFMLLLGFFIVQNVIQTYQMFQSQKELREMGLNPDQCYAELSDEEYWKFSAFVKSRLKVELEEKLVLVRVRQLLNHSSVTRLQEGERLLFFFAWLLFLVAPFVEYLWLIAPTVK